MTPIKFTFFSSPDVDGMTAVDSPVYLVSGGEALSVLLHEVDVLWRVVERPFIRQEPVQGPPGLVIGKAARCRCPRRNYGGAQTHPAVQAEADEAP